MSAALCGDLGIPRVAQHVEGEAEQALGRAKLGQQRLEPAPPSPPCGPISGTSRSSACRTAKYGSSALRPFDRQAVNG